VVEAINNATTANGAFVLAGDTNSLSFANHTRFVSSARNNWLQLGGGLTVSSTKIWNMYLYVDDIIGTGSANHGLHGIDGGLGVRVFL